MHAQDLTKWHYRRVIWNWYWMLWFTVFYITVKQPFKNEQCQKYCHSDRYFRAPLQFPQLLSMSLKIASNLSSLPQKLWGLVCQGTNRKLRQIVKSMYRLLRAVYSSYEVNKATLQSSWRSVSSYSFPMPCSHLLSVALAGSAQVFKPEHRIHSVSSLKFIRIAWGRKVQKKLIRKYKQYYILKSYPYSNSSN